MIDMLMDSMEQVHGILKKPKLTDENKVIIAAANTLAVTAKTLIQAEVIKLRADNAGLKTVQLINEATNTSKNNSLEG